MAVAQVQRSNQVRNGVRRSRRAWLLAGLTVAALSLGVAAAVARPASGVTINMIVNAGNKPGYDVLIANFERAYPNISVNVTYPSTPEAVFQVQATELAVGNAPEILMSFPGCGRRSPSACWAPPDIWRRC